MIVKPAREGSSIGVKGHGLFGQAGGRADAGRALDADVLCEQFHHRRRGHLPGAGHGDAGRGAAGDPHQWRRTGNYDYQNKYFTDDTEYLVPLRSAPARRGHPGAGARKAYRVLGCRGWGRPT